MPRREPINLLANPNALIDTLGTQHDPDLTHEDSVAIDDASALVRLQSDLLQRSVQFAIARHHRVAPFVVEITDLAYHQDGVRPQIWAKYQIGKCAQERGFEPCFIWKED